MILKNKETEFQFRVDLGKKEVRETDKRTGLHTGKLIYQSALLLDDVSNLNFVSGTKEEEKAFREKAQTQKITVAIQNKKEDELESILTA